MNKYLIGQQFPIPLVTDEVPAGEAVSVMWGATRQYPESDPTDPNVTLSGQFNVADNPTGLVGLSANVEAVGRRSIWLVSWGITKPDNTLAFGSETIIMEAYDTLVKGENSFQSYYQALMMAEEIPGLEAFKSMEKSEQIAALIYAYRIIGTMVFMSKGQIVWDIGSLNAEELDKLDPGLLEALCIAQLLEANESLDTNSAHSKRLDGIMSETIGESSMMFRSGKVATNAVVSRRSMGFLRKYLVITARITRV